ncbi:hypothetical protein CBM2585_A160005 [Cupriavidus taiwanensis]|nr:hypothetical protein CBM2585_A160005 [Cupriavidus taiwanensis]
MCGIYRLNLHRWAVASCYADFWYDQHATAEQELRTSKLHRRPRGHQTFKDPAHIRISYVLLLGF